MERRIEAVRLHPGAPEGHLVDRSLAELAAERSAAGEGDDVDDVAALLEALDQTNDEPLLTADVEGEDDECDSGMFAGQLRARAAFSSRMRVMCAPSSSTFFPRLGLHRLAPALPGGGGILGERLLDERETLRVVLGDAAPQGAPFGAERESA